MNKLKFNFILIISLTLSCSSDKEDNSNNLSNGLIAQISLNGNAIDSSGNMPDGQIIGNVNPTINRHGEANMAMEFNENEGHINFGNINELEIDYQIPVSISVWINPNGNQVGWDTILNQLFEGPPPSVPGRFYLGINPSSQKLRWRILENILESNNSIPYNEWSHIVVTYNDKNAKLYVNGSLDGEINFGDDELFFFGTGAPFKIGKQSMVTFQDTTGFSGKIDDINIFNREIEVDEVFALFQE